VKNYIEKGKSEKAIEVLETSLSEFQERNTLVKIYSIADSRDWGSVSENVDSPLNILLTLKNKQTKTPSILKYVLL